MLSPLDPSAQSLITDLNRIQDRSQRAQREISSGTRLETPSDDPDQVALVLQLQTAMARNTQIQANLNSVSSELGSADGALQTGTKLLDRALAVATQGASTATTDATRQTLADEILAMQKTMVSISQTNAGGRFLFSGDADTQAAFQFDITQPYGVQVAVYPQTNTRAVELSDGQRIQTGLTGTQIFDARDSLGAVDTAHNVFYALNQLRTALLSNNTTSIAQAGGTIKSASEYFNNQLSSYGVIERRVDQAVDDAKSLQVRLKTELSNRTDADITAAALEMQQASLNQQAAMGAYAQRPRQSLFNFLG